MAYIIFISPYNTITGKDSLIIEAESVRQLCLKIISMYWPSMGFLLDENGELSRKLVFLVNRRNAFTLSGTDTALSEDMEVIIMPYFGGG